MQALRVAGYRFRRTFGRRFSGYLAIALTLLLVGPGKLSLDAWLFGRRTMGADESPDPVRGG